MATTNRINTTLETAEQSYAFTQAGGNCTLYIMRAFKTTPTTGYIYWGSVNAADPTAQFAPELLGDLTDIVIEAIIEDARV